jgi:uncharacterized membrane protein (UPF0127 family)
MTTASDVAEPGALARLPVVELAGGLRVHDARTWKARLRGLAGVARLAPGHALRLVPCRCVHTFGMRFPVDLVWLDGRGAVTRLDAGVGALRARSCRNARAVLETNAGEGRAFAAAMPASGYTSAC